MSNSDEVGEALRYLAGCAEEYAAAVREEARLSELAKNIRAELMLASEERTQAAKEAEAMTCPNYREITEVKLPLAKREIAYHKAKQKWAETVVSVWQTRARIQREAERVR